MFKSFAETRESVSIKGRFKVIGRLEGDKPYAGES